MRVNQGREEKQKRQQTVTKQGGREGGSRMQRGGNSFGVHHNCMSCCCSNTVAIETTQYYHGHVCAHTRLFSLTHTHTEISTLRAGVSCHGSEGGGWGWRKTGTSSCHQSSASFLSSYSAAKSRQLSYDVQHLF